MKEMFSYFRLFCCARAAAALSAAPPHYQPPRRPISRPAALSALNLWLHNILKDN